MISSFLFWGWGRGQGSITGMAPQNIWCIHSIDGLSDHKREGKQSESDSNNQSNTHKNQQSPADVPMSAEVQKNSGDVPFTSGLALTTIPSSTWGTVASRRLDSTSRSFPWTVVEFAICDCDRIL